jgi:hypothetical protein
MINIFAGQKMATIRYAERFHISHIKIWTLFQYEEGNSMGGDSIRIKVAQLAVRKTQVLQSNY